MLLFILSWAIKQLIFAYWLYLLIKHRVFCVFFLFVANSGYFTIFNPHIYFIILISMIAGNLVEIRLPKIQSRKCFRKSNLWRYSRKCLWKFNSNEIRSPELSAYHFPQPKDFFLSRCLKYSLPFYNQPIVSLTFCWLWCFFIMQFIVVSITSRSLTLKNKLVTDSGHFYV